ncbi:MAG: mandelate racemase/muconate lactonizing enzyme family protein [Acidimicrobiales bacterium]|nr:mandelate racemase/muconate lactonizing enzyme family protein [Acidimicrobiales bacterium]
MCVVTTNSGVWGLGMGSLAGVTAPLINDYLAPMLSGEPIEDRERLWEMMTVACGSHFGASGVASYAISAVDLALWDAAGKLADKPVYELLGTTDPQPVRCYATGSDLEWFGELGFEAFKLACPWGPDTTAAIDQLVDLVGNGRELVGPSADLMLDCWAVQSVEHAISIGEAVRAFDIEWIEDMIYPEDWDGYSQVRSALPDHRLAAGERWYTDLPFLRAIEYGWVDVLQPDPLWVGGVTPCRRIANAAATAGYDLALHCGANDSYGQHLSAALSGNLWAEMYIGCSRGSPLMNSYRATPGMNLPLKGMLQPSDAPGFGIELSLSDIERATA